MEVDKGAAMSIISNSTHKKLFRRLKLQPSKLVLNTYTDERIQSVGQLNVYFHQYGEQRKPLALVVVLGDGPSLFRPHWLKLFDSTGTELQQSDWSPGNCRPCYRSTSHCSRMSWAPYRHTKQHCSFNRIPNQDFSSNVQSLCDQRFHWPRTWPSRESRHCPKGWPQRMVCNNRSSS